MLYPGCPSRLTSAARRTRAWLVPGDCLPGAFAAGDALALAMLAVVGVLLYVSCQRASDYYQTDSIYFDLAKTILEKHKYEFNFAPMALYPPGFPVLLALINLLAGGDRLTLLHSITVLLILGFAMAYWLLRRVEGRAVAAACCLLVATSPLVFSFVTRFVESEEGFFCASFAALLLADKLSEANHRNRLWRQLGFGFALIAAVMIRTAGVALLLALLAWITVPALRHRELARARAKLFLWPLLAALLVQAAWMAWAGRHQNPEWPLRGFPGSYVSQLSLKQGEYPELGVVGPADIPARIMRNLVDRAALATELLLGWWVNPVWYSPLVLIPLLLITCGVMASLRAACGRLHDWYFLAYEALFLLWPWRTDVRFLFPVMPLVCLYLWRGGKAVLSFASSRPRTFAAWAIAASLLSGGAAWSHAWLLHDAFGVQVEFSAGFWLLLSLCAAGLVWAGRRQSLVQLSRAVRLSATLAGLLVVGVCLGMAIVSDWRIGLANRRFHGEEDFAYPSVEAARWIASHSNPADVVMARQFAIVHHHSGRKVIWLPPISDPHVLMKGILQHHVRFVIVANPDQPSSFKPHESMCFQAVAAAYPGLFRLIYEGTKEKVYEVVAAPQLG